MGGDASGGGKLDLLLVEDNPAHAALVRRALQACDDACQVEHAPTGAAARGHLLDGPSSFDLILMDLKLPDCSGHDLVRELKDDPGRRAMPVLILTTSEAARDRERAAEVHANSYLVKPSRYPELVRLLRTALDYWRYHHAPPEETRP